MKTVLHFANIYENKASGLSFSIPNLLEGLEANNVKVDLSRTSDKEKIKQLKKYDVVVLNSFFILHHLKILLRIKKGQKLIITPRGAFSKRNRYQVKKVIYSFIYFLIIRVKRLDYKIHFLTQNEKLVSRFKTNKDFVVGNSIKIDEFTINDSILQKRFNRKEIVYIGRFKKHIKGLDILVSWLIENKTSLTESGVCFKFYGPDSRDKEYLMSRIQKNNVPNVHFYNEIYSNEKTSIIREAYFHILSSRSEGFPMSVLETTAFYVPQILSKGTNLLEDLKTFHFGLEFNKDLTPLISDMNIDKYHKMSMNAREYAEKHSIKEIGAKTYYNYIQ